MTTFIISISILLVSPLTLSSLVLFSYSPHCQVNGVGTNIHHCAKLLCSYRQCDSSTQNPGCPLVEMVATWFPCRRLNKGPWPPSPAPFRPRPPFEPYVRAGQTSSHGVAHYTTLWLSRPQHHPSRLALGVRQLG